MSPKILQWFPTVLRKKIHHFTLTWKVLHDLASGYPSDLVAYLSLLPSLCFSHTGFLSGHLKALAVLFRLCEILFQIFLRLAPCHSVSTSPPKRGLSGCPSEVTLYSSTELSFGLFFLFLFWIILFLFITCTWTSICSTTASTLLILFNI